MRRYEVILASGRGFKHHMSLWLKASPMLRDWKLIEYIVIGVLCMSIIAALFFAKP